MALDVAKRGYVWRRARSSLADDAKALRENEQVQRPTSATTKGSGAKSRPCGQVQSAQTVAGRDA